MKNVAPTIVDYLDESLLTEAVVAKFLKGQ